MPLGHTLQRVFAALPTPFGEDGAPEGGALDVILDFLLEKGVTGFCIGGATGEYAACGFEERCALFRNAARRLNGRATLLVGVGGEHYRQVIRLGRVAADCGACALLLPPPSFFAYEPADLVDFMQEIAAELPLPILFYNIPQYTSSMPLGDVLRLIEAAPNFAGIKDSSGIVESLPVLREAKARSGLAFMIGSDELLVSALEQGADGGISGTASAFPELVTGIYEAFRSGQTERAWSLQRLLNEFLARLAAFPAPWAVKLALRARGIAPGVPSWPMSGRLRRKAEEFEEWFPRWAAECEPVCAARRT